MRTKKSVPEPMNGGNQAGDSTAAANNSDQSGNVLPKKRGSSDDNRVDLSNPKQPNTQLVETCQHLGVLSLKPTKEGCDPKKYVWWPCRLCAYEIAIPEGVVPPDAHQCNTTGPISRTAVSSPPPAPSQNADLAIVVVAADFQTPAPPLITSQENAANDDGDKTHQIGHAEQELVRDDNQPIQQDRDVGGQVKRKSSRSIVLFGSATSVPTSKRSRRKEIDFMNVEQQSSIVDQSPASCKAITPYNSGQLVSGSGDLPSNSTSGGILLLQARNSYRHPIDRSASRGFPHRKPRKVRLLADLMAGNGNGSSENNNHDNYSRSRINDSPNSSHPNNLPDQRRSDHDDDRLGRNRSKRPVEIDFLNIIHRSDHSERSERNDEEGGRGDVPADGRSNYSQLGKMDHNSDQARKNEQNGTVGIQADDLDMVRPPSNNDHGQREVEEEGENIGRRVSDHDDLMAIAEFMTKNQSERINCQSAVSDRHRNLISSTDHVWPSSSSKVVKKSTRGGRMPLSRKEQPSGSGSSHRGKPSLPANAADDQPANVGITTTGRHHRGNSSDDDRSNIIMNMGREQRELPQRSAFSSASMLDARSSSRSPSSVQVSSVVTSLISDDVETVRNNRVLEISSELRDKVRAYMSSHTTSKSPVVDFDLNVAVPAPDQEQMKMTMASTALIPFLNLKGKGTSTLDNSNYKTHPNKSSVPAMPTLPAAPVINPGLLSSSFSLDRGKIKGPYMPSFGDQLQLSNSSGKMNFFERSIFPDIAGDDHLRVGPPAGESSSQQLTSADSRNSGLIPGRFSKPPPDFPVVNPFANYQQFGNSDHQNGGRSDQGSMQGVDIRPQPMSNNDPPRKADDQEDCTFNQNPADFTSPDLGNRYMISGEDLLPRGKRNA